MGVDSVGGSDSSRGTSSSTGNSTSSQSSKAENAQASAAAEASKKAAEAAAVERAAITAQTNFNVSSFTPAAPPSGMPALTAPQFSANLLNPTPVANTPTLTAPQFAANLVQATPMGPAAAFEKPAVPEAPVAPIPQPRPERPVQAANLSYGPNANAAAVSAHSQTVLGEIMASAGVTSATISSTARAPVDQARAMYDNLQAKGIESQKALYGRYGDQVIDSYAASVNAGLTKEQTLQAMVDTINAVGPSNVSRHLADPTQLNVVDIAPSSIPADRREAFQEAIRAHAEVSKFLGPADGDPAYHIEIRQPQTGA